MVDINSEQGGQGEGICGDPHHVRADQRMLQVAIKRGWIGGHRWPTDATLSELSEIPFDDMSLRERAAYAVGRDVGHIDARVRQIAAKNVIAMEKQNQADDHHADGETVRHEHTVTDERGSRLTALAERLGVGVVVIDADSRPTESHPPPVNGSQNGNGKAR